MSKDLINVITLFGLLIGAILAYLGFRLSQEEGAHRAAILIPVGVSLFVVTIFGYMIASQL